MTLLWIITGILTVVAAVVSFGFLRQVGMFVIVLVLAIFSRVVLERKFVARLVEWFHDRDEEGTVIGLAIIGWIIVFLTVFGIPGIAYQVFRALS